MERLVDSLFLFSKLDLGKVPFHWEIVSLVDYFTDYIEETKPRLLERYEIIVGDTRQLSV